MALFKRYGPGAKIYDLVSGERLVYRAGRRDGVRALGLSRGDIVIDIGCGTGLNLPLLIEAIGADGLVIAVDRSPDMLRMARRRVARAGWPNVVFLEADLTTLDSTRITHVAQQHRGRPRADAAFATYALSLIDDRPQVWSTLRSSLRSGARVGIVDMALPVGWARVLAPLALIACALGGADIRAHPWTELQRVGTDVTHTTRRGGHLQIVAGSLR